MALFIQCIKLLKRSGISKLIYQTFPPSRKASPPKTGTLIDPFTVSIAIVVWRETAAKITANIWEIVYFQPL